MYIQGITANTLVAAYIKVIMAVHFRPVIGTIMISFVFVLFLNSIKYAIECSDWLLLVIEAIQNSLAALCFMCFMFCFETFHTVCSESFLIFLLLLHMIC